MSCCAKPENEIVDALVREKVRETLEPKRLFPLLQSVSLCRSLPLSQFSINSSVSLLSIF